MPVTAGLPVAPLLTLFLLYRCVPAHAASPLPAGNVATENVAHGHVADQPNPNEASIQESQ
jgi:hypothetical protein